MLRTLTVEQYHKCLFSFDNFKSLFPFFFSRPHSQGIKKKSSHCWWQSYLQWLTTLMCFHVLLLFWLAVNTSLTFTSKPQRWQPLTMHLIFSKASSRSSWVDIYIYIMTRKGNDGQVGNLSIVVQGAYSLLEKTGSE